MEPPLRPRPHSNLEGAGEEGTVCLSAPARRETPIPRQSTLAASAAGPPVSELGMPAPALPLPGPCGRLMRERRCRNTPESPQHQANVKRHHEKLKCAGLKEKQHLGRNYCDLRGGCGPVCNSEIWKQCLNFYFYFFKLVRILIMKLWCERPDVRSKIVKNELCPGGVFLPSTEPS